MALLSTELTLNYDAVLRMVMTVGRVSLAEAQEEMEGRAKKHAPVRDVFARTGNRRSEQVPRGVFRKGDQIFGRKVRHHTAERQDRFLRQVKAQKAPNRQATIDDQRVRASSRGIRPLLGNKGSRSQGPYRRVSLDGGRASLRPVEVRSEGSASSRALQGQVKGGELNRANRVIGKIQSARKAAGQPALQPVDIRRELGRASISFRKKAGLETLDKAQQAKAKILRGTALHVSASGELTLGGRLRDEIYSGEITQDGSVLYADVISPTDYGKYQEYGTSRHRAQPYMRPALYEMRTRFPLILKRALRQRRTA